jgi:DNA-3-methyladenine glycosylase I
VSATGLAPGPDERPRCWWAVGSPDYVAYHDDEWGRPVTGDRELYERLTLEAFQSGLSWLTILRKRDGFRAAFAGFDAEVVARYGEPDVERLMGDTAIVRNRAKIVAAIANARALVALRDAGGSLTDMVWRHRPADEAVPRSREELPGGQTAESRALARELKRHGFVFVGPTTAYSTMEACGVVNDHLAGCCVREAVERERAALAPQSFVG